MMGYDDRPRQDRSTGLVVVLVVGLAILAALLFGFARKGHAQAGAGGPIPNVVGSQYLSTPDSVANKQLVPFRVLPDGTLVVSSGGGSSGGTVTTWTAARVDVTPTVQNASYVSGNDIGGLVSFTLARTASGYIQSVGVQFVGGATTAINAFCFDSNPTGSTFTDKSTFTIAAADEAKRINKTGYSLTPAAVVGDTVTGAAVDNLAKPFNSTGTIYCAYASTGTFTPASTTDMRVNITYVQSAQ